MKSVKNKVGLGRFQHRILLAIWLKSMLLMVLSSRHLPRLVLMFLPNGAAFHAMVSSHTMALIRLLSGLKRK